MGGAQNTSKAGSGSRLPAPEISKAVMGRPASRTSTGAPDCRAGRRFSERDRRGGIRWAGVAEGEGGSAGQRRDSTARRLPEAPRRAAEGVPSARGRAPRLPCLPARWQHSSDAEIAAPPVALPKRAGAGGGRLDRAGGGDGLRVPGDPAAGEVRRP